MSLFRRRDPEASRAELLDSALSAWQHGDDPEGSSFDGTPDSIEPIGDELAVAHALEAFVASVEAPSEPLVTLRAALAVQASRQRAPRWRRAVISPRFAAAVAAFVAAMLGIGVSSTVRSGDERVLPAVAAASAQRYLDSALEKVAFVTTASQQSVPADPAVLNRVIVQAQADASAARAAAQFAGGEDRKVLLARVEFQQRQIAALRTKVLLLAAPQLVTPDDVAPTTTTSTTTKPTTTTEAPTTTTSRPATTTAKPTTTTTEPPATTTTRPPEPTTTTQPPAGTTTTLPAQDRNTNDLT